MKVVKNSKQKSPFTSGLQWALDLEEASIEHHRVCWRLEFRRGGGGRGGGRGDLWGAAGRCLRCLLSLGLLLLGLHGCFDGGQATLGCGVTCSTCTRPGSSACNWRLL